MKHLLIRDLKLAFRAGGGFGLALGFFLILVVLFAKKGLYGLLTGGSGRGV